jgi:hypothetical protein
VFFKKKYPDNWEEALKWTNSNVLRPIGDHDSLTNMIRDHKGRKWYHYLCKEQPICDYCDSEACRKKPYGVGDRGPGQVELGMTVMRRDDDATLFIVNVGSQRIHMQVDEIMNLKKYQNKCLEYSVPFPDNMIDKDWKDIIRKAREEAIEIEAPGLLRPHATELEMLEAFFGRHITFMVRNKGQEFLDGKVGDVVRVRVKEERIYFKPLNFLDFVRRSYMLSNKEIHGLKMYLVNHTEEHGRTDSKGGWYRSTRSINFGLLNAELLHNWLRTGADDAEET